MKIVQINAACGSGSTGRICLSISKMLTARGVENYILHSTGNMGYPLGISCSNAWEIRAESLKAHVFGDWGFHSRIQTRRMIRELETIQPDIVHLHNIHGHDCNLQLLFDYFREKGTSLVWTFHDCWAFTGYCTHFDMVRCDRWKRECGSCPLWQDYSFFLDRSARLLVRKKALFSGLNLTIVAPSRWMAEQVKESFLKNYPVRMIHNGIDLKVFQPTPGNMRNRHGLRGRNIVLGVASGWSRRKGLDVFLELANRLGADYQVVLVGTDDRVDRQLPRNILSIHRTRNQRELAEIYTAADVFVNPTREDNYPTVNMEAIACGTPVVTFSTGGSPEIPDENSGITVPKEDTDAMQAQIERICDTRPYSQKQLSQRALKFHDQDRFQEYISLYKEIYDRTSDNRI